MCASSAVSDYYLQQWPQRFPATPNILQVADHETKRLLREVMERLDKIDKRLGDVECHDAAKQVFLDGLGG